VTTASALRHGCVIIVLHTLVGCASPAPKLPSDEGWSALGDGGAPPAAPSATLAPAPRLKARPEAERVAYEVAPDSLTTLPGRDASEHGMGLTREVLINAAAEPYRAAVGHTPLPEGALIVQRHRREGSEAAVSSYAMRKQADGWEFTVIDAQWRVALRGALAECVRCHADAPFDGTFGPPSEAPRAQP
jgi:hypothetical protein